MSPRIEDSSVVKYHIIINPGVTVWESIGYYIKPPRAVIQKTPIAQCCVRDVLCLLFLPLVRQHPGTAIEQNTCPHKALLFGLLSSCWGPPIANQVSWNFVIQTCVGSVQTSTPTSACSFIQSYEIIPSQITACVFISRMGYLSGWVPWACQLFKILFIWYYTHCKTVQHLLYHFIPALHLSINFVFIRVYIWNAYLWLKAFTTWLWLKNGLAIKPKCAFFVAWLHRKPFVKDNARLSTHVMDMVSMEVIYGLSR